MYYYYDYLTEEAAETHKWETCIVRSQNWKAKAERIAGFRTLLCSLVVRSASGKASADFGSLPEYSSSNSRALTRWSVAAAQPQGQIFIVWSGSFFIRRLNEQYGNGDKSAMASATHFCVCVLTLHFSSPLFLGGKGDRALGIFHEFPCETQACLLEFSVEWIKIRVF